MFTTTLADLLSILEKATSGETGIHASGGRAPQLTAAACVYLAWHLFLCTTCLAPLALHHIGLPCPTYHGLLAVSCLPCSQERADGQGARPGRAARGSQARGRHAGVEGAPGEQIQPC